MSGPADDERFAYFVVFDAHGGPPRCLRAEVVNITKTGVRFRHAVPLEARDRITMETERVDWTPATALARAYATAVKQLDEAQRAGERASMRVAELKHADPAVFAIEDVR